ncbi:MAG: amino acid ABC transporter permease [Bacillota bacterium]|nr:amino acid ABC transporter permease [Bacillota bacterium]
MNLFTFLDLARQLSYGVQYTLELFFITLIFGLPLGLILGLIRNAGKNLVNTHIKILDDVLNTVISAVVGFYVWIMRGTPLLLQMVFVYFGLAVMQVAALDPFPAACVTFALNYAAYFCEIFRGGLLSVEKGQHEAASVLGFTPFKKTIHIIIPQMFRVCLPTLANECITLVKDTSLIYALSITEILTLATDAVRRTTSPAAYVVAAVFYLIFTFLITQFFKYLEKKFSF